MPSYLSGSVLVLNQLKKMSCNIFVIFLCLLVCTWRSTLIPIATGLEVASKLNRDELLLANKIEKLLTIKGHPKIEAVKEELGNQIGYNFLKILSTKVIGGMRDRIEKHKILKLMRQIANDELDFMPVVEKIPNLLRKTNESEKLELILKSIGVKGNKDPARQAEEEEAESDGEGESEAAAAATAAPKAATPATNVSTTTPSPINKILDAASNINIKEISSFLKEIPDIFEGIETIVDGVDEFFD